MIFGTVFVIAKTDSYETFGPRFDSTSTHSEKLIAKKFYRSQPGLIPDNP